MVDNLVDNFFTGLILGQCFWLVTGLLLLVYWVVPKAVLVFV